MRVAFDQVFRKHNDGTLEPRQMVRIGGVSISPGIRFGNGAVFGGVDLARYQDADIEVATDGKVVVIRGIYDAARV